MPAHKKHSTAFRAEFLAAQKSGIPVQKICREFNISRKTFYKWKSIFENENHTQSRSQGRKSTVDKRIESIVFDLVKLHPEWSLNKIYQFLTEQNNNKQLVSRTWLQKFLKKYSMNTAYSRQVLSYRSLSSLQTANTLDNTQSDLPQLDSQQVYTSSDSSPPYYQFNLKSLNSFTRNLLNLVSAHPYKLLFTVLISLFNAYLFSLIVKHIFEAEGILQKFGLILSGMALFCGAFFFLYSLKYYITIIMVIFKSGEVLNKSQHLNSFLNLINRFKSSKISRGIDPQTLHKMVEQETLAEYPFFSIHIALYNEKKVADRVVSAALKMDYPNFEVVVCDDSTDETTEILRQNWANHPQVKIIHRPERKGFKGAALANALNYIDQRTDYIVVFDADFVPYPDALTLFAKYFSVIAKNEANNYSNTGLHSANRLSNHYINTIITHSEAAKSFQGKTVAVQGYQWHVLNKSENWITRGVRTEFSGSYIIERSGTQIAGLLKQIAGSVYAINASVLKEVGWGSSITEDFQLTLKLYQQGYKVAYTPYIQAPSECVSTLKRLIRQRQRWAEGHSYNIKLYLNDILTSSKISSREKWEALYLAPYYLQTVFFIVGTFAWFISETLLKTHLPFWTAALGWSLVLTNLFSLPLMNTIGLFLEDGDERDYLGIFSFVSLSYILTPFIAIASLKGFFEKSEGPWFRTPKSGRITDVVKRDSAHESAIGKFYTNPFLRPIFDIFNKIYGQSAGEISPYLAYTTAGNLFSDNIQFSRVSKLKKTFARFLVILLLGLTTIANVLQTTIPQAFANPDTYYVRAGSDSLFAENLTSTSSSMRTAMSSTIGASTQNFTINSTNTTFYTLTDNLNQRWTNDTKINDTNTTGERRNVAISTDSNGNTVAVWEDSRNTSTTFQDRFDSTRGGMVRGRYGYTANLLHDGRVLYVGGYSDTVGNYQSSAEIYDPIANTFSLISGTGSNISAAKYTPTAVTLNDGRVLIAGGVNNTTEYSSTSLFDPNTNTFSNGPNLSTSRAWGTSILLNNGKVLIVGGCTVASGDICTSGFLSSAELFDPLNNTMSAAGNMSVARAYHGSIYLPNGEILVAGGQNGTELSSTEIYDPVANSWRKGPNMSVARSSPGIVNIDNDKVLVVGGVDGTNNLSSTEIFEISSQTWTSGANIRSGLAGEFEERTPLMLGNGKIFIAGDSTNAGSVYSLAEIYDPLTNTSTATSFNMPAVKGVVKSILLNNGKILLAGGLTSGAVSSTTALLYTPITYDIYAQKYDKAGAKLWNSGTDIRVNSDDGSRHSSSGPPLYNHLNPTVAQDASGNAVIAWEEQRDGVYNASIWSQKLQSSDGAKLWPQGTDDSFNVANGTLSYIRYGTDSGAQATPLTNGKVLITGTESSNAGRTIPEIYDPAAGTFTFAAALNKPRWNHQATPLLNGKVLLSGTSNSLADSSSAEIFDPNTNTSAAATGLMTSSRVGHISVLLKNGKVFVAGGSTQSSSTSLTTTEIFDPVTGTFSAAAGMTHARRFGSGLLLPNGKVFLIGDSNGGTGSTVANIYDPFSNSMTVTPAFSGAKGWNSALLLNNGKVLVAGNTSASVSTAQIFDPTTNSWSATGNMPGSYKNHSLSLLPNGKVLASGGINNSGSAALSSALVYDPAANTWSSTTNQNSITRRNAKSVYLPQSNKILVVQGEDLASNSTAELYTPAADMPVNQYNYKDREVYTNSNLGGFRFVFNKKPKLAVDSNGDAVIVWQDNKFSRSEFQGNSHPYANTAYYQYEGNPVQKNQCFQQSDCGATIDLASLPVRLLAQKICNQNNCADNGTTSGERQWGNDLNQFNTNSPEDIGVSSVINGRAPSLITDTTNSIITYHSDAGSTGTITKTNKIYSQKLNTAGTTQWSYGFTSSGNFNAARRGMSATLLNDGKILITAGQNSTLLSSGELFNPFTGAYSNISNNIQEAKYDHSATLLNTGRVLISGGANSSGDGLSTTTIYNPVTGTFSAGPNLSNRRAAHISVLLRNGQVLIAGGRQTSLVQLSQAELYNPSTNALSAAASMNSAHARPQTALLNDGRVIVAGGYNNAAVDVQLSTVEIYDPVANAWSNAASMSSKRDNFTLIALGNGKLLAVGGYDGTSYLSTAEVYDPLANSWTATGSLSLGGRSDHTSQLLPDGRVVIFGGTSNGTNELSSSEIYDPRSGSWSAGPNFNTARKSHRSMLTTDGKIYLFGGWDDSATYSSSEHTSIDQKISTADNTNSTSSDLIKDSDGNIQIVWQAWRSEGLSPNASGGSWQILGQKINNPSNGTITYQWPNGTTNNWSTTSNAITAREKHYSVVLPNGKVFLVGGNSGTITTTDIYDPYTNTWTSGASTSIGKYEGGDMLVLTNGKVMIFGGQGANDVRTDLYDPGGNTWTQGNNFVVGRQFFGNGVVLNDGKVLASGGRRDSTFVLTTTAELYDPSTGTWSNTGGLVAARQRHRLVKLNSGQVLAIGGCSNDATCTGNTMTSSEIYNPAAASWSTVAGLSTARRDMLVSLLNDGRILAYGGYDNSGNLLSSAEIYDPLKNSWTAAATAPTAAANVFNQSQNVVLPNGKVLFDMGASSSTPIIYDPFANTWSSAGAHLYARANAPLLLLKNGKVFVAGGNISTASTTAEIFTPDLSEKLISSPDSNLNSNKTDPRVASDSSDGVSFVAWSDQRLTSPSDTVVDSNIYFQKLHNTGNPIWPNGLNESGTYDVRDIRVNNSRGSLDTSLQKGVSISKSTFANTAADRPLQLAWTDSRDTSPSLNIYGQSFDTLNYTMNSSDWTASFYVNSANNTNKINVQLGAVEADGESEVFSSSSSVFTGDSSAGQKQILFSNLPPSAETSLTHKRIIMKFSYNSGSLTISYNGSAGVADTRIEVGTVVPERSVLLSLIIPLLPGVVLGYRKKRSLYRWLYLSNSRNK